MALKRFSCRTHGGIFTKESLRGRPPVRCAEEYPCDKADGAVMASPEKSEKLMSRIKNNVREVPGVGKVAVITRESARGALPMTPARVAKQEALAQAYGKPAEHHAKPTSGANDSLPLAKRAKAQLEAAGWVCKGRAWFEERVGNEHFAELICSRGAETLVMVWQNGVLQSQDYQMEHLRESDNGLPGRKLDFDPDELTDREIVQRISGMKVTWWSVLASSTESAVVPGDKVKIEHIFVGNGDEDNSKRIVTFVDRNNGGFRSFHVSALMKVG